MVNDLEMQELNEEDINSVSGEKPQQSNRQRLRQVRKEIVSQTKKNQACELVQRRQEVEKKVNMAGVNNINCFNLQLFEDSSGTDSTSNSSSPFESTPPMVKHLDTWKTVTPRKKKCAANIKQPKGNKGDNRRSAK